MKEWNILVDYIDFYIYDENTEAVVIGDSPKAERARAIYDHFLEKYDIKDSRVLEWAFDIALDCIRNMKEEDRQYLTEKYEADFFGYGLYIRNKYIHSAKLHQTFFADRQSSRVLSFIYTIMHRYYDRFNDELCTLLDNYTYQKIYDLYSDKYSFIEEEVMLLTENNSKKTADEVFDSICKKLRNELGSNNFKDVFVSIVKDVGKDCLQPTPWLDLLNKLFDRAPIYKKEYNQVIALKETGLIRDLVNGTLLDKDIYTAEEYKNHIMDNIGFSEEDAQIMAECMWAAFKE